MCKLNCKSFLNTFGLKNRQYYLRRWQWKGKEILRMLLGQIIDIWSNGHRRTRGFHALDSLCSLLLRWRRQIKRNIRILWSRHPRRNCKHFHAIYMFQCVLKLCTAQKILTYFIIVFSSNGNNNNWMIVITKMIRIAMKVLF